jgi:hypothetical protein
MWRPVPSLPLIYWQNRGIRAIRVLDMVTFTRLHLNTEEASGWGGELACLRRNRPGAGRDWRGAGFVPGRIFNWGVVAMHCCKWLCGGILGGLIGGTAWVMIELLTHKEFGWIAWVVGVLVGLGVHVASSKELRGGFLRGAVAALLALAAIIGAKVSLAQIMTHQAAKAAQPAVGHDSHSTGSEAPADAATGGDGPNSLAVPPEEIERDVLRESLDSTQESSFKDWDMLWLCLGAITAYIVGKGAGPDTLPSDEPSPEMGPSHQQLRTEAEAEAGVPAAGKEEEAEEKNQGA